MGMRAAWCTWSSTLQSSSRAAALHRSPARAILQQQHPLPRAPGRLLACGLATCAPSALDIDVDCLPRHILLLRHGQTADLASLQAQLQLPNHRIPISAAGAAAAKAAGGQLRALLQKGWLDGHHGSDLQSLEQEQQQQQPLTCFVYSSPYLRCIQTAQHVARALDDSQVAGVQEDVQLREQDWGNFQEPLSAAQCYQDRLQYGRFFYRFPNGESASDVYDRLTIWQDHFVRDLAAGRFAGGVVLLVSHGLTLRVWLMRWLHWRVDQFLQVHNIPHATPLVLTLRRRQQLGRRLRCTAPAVKGMYEMTPATAALLSGVGEDMAVYAPVADRASLLSWRPYWDMVPAVPGTEQEEAALHEIMTIGYQGL